MFDRIFTILNGLGSAPPHARADERLVRLFDALKRAPSADVAETVEGEIWQVWCKSSDEVGRRLMQEGISALAGGRIEPAEIAFGRVIGHDPDFAEKEAKVDEARAQYRAALALRQGLLKTDPKNARYLLELAMTHSKLGALPPEAGKPADEGADHREALRVLQDLVRDYPQNATYRQELATSYGRLGQSALRAGRAAAAKEAHEKALALREALVKDDEKNAEWQRDLLLSHLELGRLSTGAQRRGHVQGARALLGQLEVAELLKGDQEIERARESIAELRRKK